MRQRSPRTTTRSWELRSLAAARTWWPSRALVELLGAEAGLRLKVIPLDTRADAIHGNPLADKVVAFWKDQTLKGRVIASGGGPICASRSSARWVTPRAPNDPRPLRSMEEPWRRATEEEAFPPKER